MQEPKRIRLRASPEGSASWIYFLDDGSLRIELYDYGEDAQNTFGNDIAFLVTVAAREKRRMLKTLAPMRALEEDAAFDDDLLLRLMVARFGSYFDVKAWLEQHEIPYKHLFDSWA